MEPRPLLAIVFSLADAILGLMIAVLIVYVVISWLYAFDIVGRRNPLVNSVWEFCRRVTDPILRPFRRLIPPIAGVDLSVLVVMLLVQIVLRQGLLPWGYTLLTGRPAYL